MKSRRRNRSAKRSRWAWNNSPDGLRNRRAKADARREAQARALQEAGIPFRQVASRIIVSRHHAREWLAGRIITPSHEPNLGAIL